MKKKNQMKQSQLSKTAQWFSVMRTGTRKGFGVVLTALLLAGGVQNASAYEVVKSYDYQTVGSNLEGYVVSIVDPNSPDRGTAIMGNYHLGNGIHFAVVDGKGAMSVSKLFKFPETEDVRAISIATVDANVFMLTIQARGANRPGHILELMVDVNGNIINRFDIEAPSPYGKHLFPSHSIVMNGYLYICGYTNTRGEWPVDPLFFHDKSAFVARMDMNNGATNIRFYNTNLNTNGVTNINWDGTINDYDAAMRLKNINGRLYVLGSANGSTTLGTSTSTINGSKAWVSQLNLTTLAPLSSGFYGNSSVPASFWPNTANGSYALELIADTQTPNTFYCLSNDLNNNTWKLAHLGSTLALSVPTSGSNSIYYSTTASIKSNGMFPTTNGGNRISLYGMVGTAVPLASSTAYGSVISSPVNGAIPFVIGMDLGYSNAGISYNNQWGAVEGNNLSYATSLDYQQPFWTQGGLREWCNLPFAHQFDPLSGSSDDLAMIGHFKNNTNSAINPRFLATNGDGKIATCPSDQQMTLGLGYTSQTGVTISLNTDLGNPYGNNYPVDEADLLLYDELECSATSVYRTAKPGSAIAETDVKGIYPNPASDHVTIQLGKDAQDGAAVKVVLSDVTGRIVYSSQANAAGGRLELNLPRLTAGMYQASVVFGDAKPVSYKLVIR